MPIRRRSLSFGPIVTVCWCAVVFCGAVAADEPPTKQAAEPSLWDQTGGKLHGFVCAVGTGGTLAGVGMALKERDKDIVIGLADPPGAALYNYYKHGELKAEGVTAPAVPGSYPVIAAAGSIR